MTRRPAGLPRRLSLEGFLDRVHEITILVDPPYRVVACDCGDVNCQGWRVVAIADQRPAVTRGDLTWDATC
jgi:hypothetical protein